MSKNQNIEEFLAKGGKIEKLPPAQREDSQTIGNTTYHAPQFLSLEEADELYGESKKRGALDTDEDIVDALAKIVQRDPSFIERKNIPKKYVEQLPKELQDAGALKIKSDIKRINEDQIRDDRVEVVNGKAINIKELLQKHSSKVSSGKKKDN